MLVLRKFYAKFNHLENCNHQAGKSIPAIWKVVLIVRSNQESCSHCSVDQVQCSTYATSECQRLTSTLKAEELGFLWKSSMMANLEQNPDTG